MRSREYLDAIRAKYQCSDYGASKLLGVSKQTVSNYRNEVDGFGDDTAIRAAELLGLEPAEVIINTLADRSKSEQARKILRGVVRSLRAAAAVSAKTGAIALFLLAMWTASTPRAEAMSAQDSGMYIMSNRRRMALAA